MKLTIIGIIIVLLTTTVASTSIILGQQASAAISGQPGTGGGCQVGTGGTTGKPCLPCDIGLGTGYCYNPETGSRPCPRYGPIPPWCTRDPFNPLNQAPGSTLGGPKTGDLAQNNLLQPQGGFGEQPPFGFRDNVGGPLAGGGVGLLNTPPDTSAQSLGSDVESQLGDDNGNDNNDQGRSDFGATGGSFIEHPPDPVLPNEKD